jgi:hypothetical protein
MLQLRLKSKPEIESKIKLHMEGLKTRQLQRTGGVLLQIQNQESEFLSEDQVVQML